MLRTRWLIVLMAVGGLVVAATEATAYWSGFNHPLQGVGAAKATSVNQGEAPTVELSGGDDNLLVAWTASTLANGQPVDGYRITRYDAVTDAVQTTLAGCAGTITATSCNEANVPAGEWTYTVAPVIGTHWRGAESPDSEIAVTLDTQAPTQSLSLTNAVGAYLTGETLYYKGNVVGSFKLVDSVSDSGTGPASATFPAIATTGWTHLGETVTTPSGGPYTSATFSWAANPSNPAGYSVSAADMANNSSSTPVTFVNDTTPPAGGSVSYPNGTVITLSVPVSTANGSDGQSGIDASTATLTRAQANLGLLDLCGSFGPFNTTVTLVDGADTSVTSGHCYRYRYSVSDRVGNGTTYTSSSTVKVDTG